VLYILRHTWGFQDTSKRITSDEFEHGRKRIDGTRSMTLVSAWRALALLLLSSVAVALLIVWGSAT